MASDALDQFVATVHRLDGAGPRSYAERSQYSDIAGSLNTDEAWACLRQQQLWLAAFPPDESALIIDRLVELANVYRVVNPPTLQTIYKSETRPGGAGATRGGEKVLDDDDDDLEDGDRFDAAAWLDRGLEDITREHAPSEREPMELLLFKTMALVLMHVAELE